MAAFQCLHRIPSSCSPQLSLIKINRSAPLETEFPRIPATHRSPPSVPSVNALLVRCFRQKRTTEEVTTSLSTAVVGVSFPRHSLGHVIPPPPPPWNLQRVPVACLQVRFLSVAQGSSAFDLGLPLPCRHMFPCSGQLSVSCMGLEITCLCAFGHMAHLLGKPSSWWD